MSTPILAPETDRPVALEPARSRGARRRRTQEVASAAPGPSGGQAGSRLPGLILAIGALLLIAAGIGMRLYAFGDHPRGLWYDEAMYALDAVRVLGGAHPIYFPANDGREPLFIYLAAATIHGFGHTPLGLRAAALICGLLTLAAAYLLGLAWGNRRVGLLCAAILAVMLWHVHLSRIGLRVVSLPLFVALSLGLGAMALRSRARWLLVAAGVAFGLCFYTYLAARVTPIAVLGMAAYGFFWHRGHLRGRGRDFAWMLGAAVIVALPLMIYAVRHPDHYFARGDHLAIWSTEIARGDPLGAIRDSFLRTVGMFTWRGDAISRHNVPGRPIFDPLLAVPFLGGVAMAVFGWRRRPAWALSLIWIAAMSLPTLLAEDAPHFLRAAGLLPVVALLPALTLDEWLRRRRHPSLAAAGIVLLLAASATLTARDYFGSRPPTTFRLSGFDYAGCYRSDPGLRLAFQSDVLGLAREIESVRRPSVLDCHVYPAVRFLAPNADRLYSFDWNEQPPVVPPPFTLVACPRYRDASVMDVLPPSVRITVTPSPTASPNKRGVDVPMYVRWDVDRLDEGVSSRVRPLASFGNGLMLRSVQPSRTADTLQLRFCWTKSGGGRPEAQVQVEILDATGETLGTAREVPGSACCDPSHWTPGSNVIHTVSLPLPRTATGALQLRLRLRDRATGEEVPILATSARRQGDTVLLVDCR